MRKITSNYIFSPDLGLLKYGIIVIGSDNRIVEIIDTHGSITEIQGLEFYSGLVSVGRFEYSDLLKYSGKKEMFIEEVLGDILKDKPLIGLTIIEDVDFSNSKIKSSSKVKILI